MKDEEFVCLNCEFVVNNNDEYCPNCGTIFIEDKKCYIHKEIEADGICLICLKPYCKKCGLQVNIVFLCNEHSRYEIIEGMGRIYGSSDYLESSFYKDV